jgi:hypothetical protein
MYRQVPQSLLQPSLFGQSVTWALQSGWNRGTWRPHFLTCASGPLAGSAECVLPIVMRCRCLCFSVFVVWLLWGRDAFWESRVGCLKV